jgi:MarC family membrane protein
VDYVSASVLLFFVMDPFGNLPVFASVLESVPPERRRRVLLRELFIALGVLIVFLLAGRPLLEVMGLRGASVSIAGGIIMFLIGLAMVRPADSRSQPAPDVEGEPLIVPLAIPLIAGPSSMATLLLLTSRDPAHLGRWAAALLTAWAVTAAILMASGPLAKLLRRRGMIALERLMGMVIIALSVQLFLDGTAAYFHLDVNGGFMPSSEGS